MQNKENSSLRILSEDELNRMIALPDRKTHIGLRDRAMLELLVGAGLKVQELLSLCPGDINLQISCIILPKDCDQQDRPGKSIRMIPFGMRTRTAILEYLYDIRAQIAGPDALLFSGRGGRMLTRQAVWKVVKKYAVLSGIDHPVSPEDLRASFAVLLLEQGADPAAVQDLLGISTAAMKKYIDIKK